MNRLVIIGNGFDLAHGLPTSYNNFLNWIWKNLNKDIGSKLITDLFELDSKSFKIDRGLENYSDFQDYVSRHFSRGSYRIEESTNYNSTFKVFYREHNLDSWRVVFSFSNKLFELITVNNIENWVDIENVYYTALKSIVKEDDKFRQLGTVKKLNADFEQIKELLHFYIDNEVEQNYIFDKTYDKCASIVSLFEYHFKNLEKQPYNDLFSEFPANYRNSLIEFDKLFDPDIDPYKNDAFQTMFVDFNYTSNVSNYVSIMSNMGRRGYGQMMYTPIHGQINDLKNPINFGFGDEMDDHYKMLENTGDNAFLKNIKSFMYFNNSNYRNLLNWIESDDYQIFIMGHSCGLSDRTLLNTLFEHNNCKSIKIFYHERDGKDNFTELSQNISRHFNKKSMMREKVVDKSLSKPLPQNVRYEIKSL
ncbi:Bacteriophage abortive infection AbiH [Chryseobacterium carnipullorum]|uniref:AbiH family protein n=1 Tax=Chryseobacterium carnipullorum TaxID=1124835 RepID=UPI0009218351|nr:AbiH family protein [Chryseobacterium carnipullorum]SHM93716.1 Bacteriophage abortive infection AbiH [Chryseobacterium carnipullorum]